eukprot:1531734-Rhodomonas_salina.1
MLTDLASCFGADGFGDRAAVLWGVCSSKSSLSQATRSFPVRTLPRRQALTDAIGDAAARSSSSSH